MGTSPFFSASFLKGGNVCVFLFAYLAEEVTRMTKLLGKNFYLEEQLCYLKHGIK